MASSAPFVQARLVCWADYMTETSISPEPGKSRNEAFITFVMRLVSAGGGIINLDTKTNTIRFIERRPR